MFKEKMKRFSRFLLENSKLILPIVIILAVAITVLCALRAQDVYYAVCQDMLEHPERREFYKSEIRNTFEPSSPTTTPAVSTTTAPTSRRWA